MNAKDEVREWTPQAGDRVYWVNGEYTLETDGDMWWSKENGKHVPIWFAAGLMSDIQRGVVRRVSAAKGEEKAVTVAHGAWHRPPAPAERSETREEKAEGLKCRCGEPAGASGLCYPCFRRECDEREHESVKLMGKAEYALFRRMLDARELAKDQAEERAIDASYVKSYELQLGKGIKLDAHELAHYARLTGGAR